MVRVSIRVRSGAARIDVRVMAASAERAASIAESYLPGENVGVLLPGAPRSSDEVRADAMEAVAV